MTAVLRRYRRAFALALLALILLDVAIGAHGCDPKHSAVAR